MQSARKTLEKFGFKIIEKEVPIDVHEIRNPALRSEILEDGCCGIDELLKLHAWTMMEYDRKAC